MNKEYTCTEYLHDMQPLSTCYMMYSKNAINNAKRRAHFVAVSIGLDWSPHGQYPAGVWGLVFP